MSNGTRGQGVASLLFMSFIRVADDKGRIDSSDIERLTALMSNTAWATHPLLVDGLECLREGYDKLWRDYANAKAPVQVEAIRLRAAVTMIGLSERQTRKYRDSLVDFLHRAIPLWSPPLSMLQSSAAAERRVARDAVEQAFGRAANENSAPRPARSAEPAVAAAVVAAPVSPPVSVEPPLSPASRDPAAPWTGGRIDVECVRVDDETHDVKTFTFACPAPRLFHYKPGQFATLELTIEGRRVKRSYTLSSSPSRPHTLSVTVKRVPGGLASNWLHDHLHPGSVIGLSGPFGKFNGVDAFAPKLLLIGGGSGVTPMMSMLRWFADTAAAVDIVFLNHVRTPDDVIFEHELHHLATRYGDRLRLLVVPSGRSLTRSWMGHVGRFEGAFLAACVPDFRERLSFLCGPQPYMDAVVATLGSLGYPMHQLHQESFGAAPRPAVAAPAPAPAQVLVASPAPPMRRTIEVAPVAAREPVEAPAPAAGVVVKLQDSGQTLTCQPEETVLEAADRLGIDMEHSCRTGRCGTCRMKVVSGQARMDEQESLSEADIESGYTLPCVARPVTPLVLAA